MGGSLLSFLWFSCVACSSSIRNRQKKKMQIVDSEPMTDGARPVVAADRTVAATRVDAIVNALAPDPKVDDVHVALALHVAVEEVLDETEAAATVAVRSGR